jgi:hypothetical protein
MLYSNPLKRPIIPTRRKLLVLSAFLASLIGVQLAYGQTIQLETQNTQRTIRKWDSPDTIPGLIDTKSNFDVPTKYYWAAFKKVINDRAKAKLDSLDVEVTGFAGTFPAGTLYRIKVNGKHEDVLQCLKLEQNFINLTPIWVEEKIERKIFENEGLAYVDSLGNCQMLCIKAYPVIFHAPFKNRPS